MEIFIAGMLIAMLAQTSFLTVKAIDRGSVPKGSILMDTSALIDGRIVPIARSGLVSARLIVPKSVIAELQFMADKADHDKRERARFGLDVIDSLQQLDTVSVYVVDDRNVTQVDVDEQLMRLAIKYKARLCTIDYNLNKAARVQNIEVININELAHALRIVHLPGEQTVVKIVQAGQEARQGVGYLDDGTMVVVEDAKSLIDKEVSIIVTRVLQTAAGKMMFARLIGSTAKIKSAQSDQRTHGRNRQQKQAVTERVEGRRQTKSPQKNNRKSTAAKSRTSRQSPQQRAESSLVALANQEKDPHS